MATWRVEEKTVPVRDGATLASVGHPDVPDEGFRYRYVCSCGHTGRWWKDPNLADGDDHLYVKHGEGE